MKRTSGRILALALAFAMMAAMVPGVPAGADDGVEYIDVDGEEKTQDGVTPVASETTSWANGWYVVNGTVTVADRITVTGEVYLILADNCTLTASQGISVNEGNSLTIYAQSNGSSMGKLEAHEKAETTFNYQYAPIGGDRDSSSGDITINGGNITATASQTGSYGATGIGCGNGGSNGTITINGGAVTATGGDNHEAIGGKGSNITINGGTVKATAHSVNSRGCAAIGGRGSTITITGGNITASTDSDNMRSSVGAAIGANATSEGETLTITISGGLIYAQQNIGVGYAIGQAASSDNGKGTVVFSTGENGSAVIYGYNSLPTEENLSCVYFNTRSSTHSVYGSPAPTVDFEVPSGRTLTVPEGAALIIPNGVTMTVNGNITNNGHVIKEAGGTIVYEGNISPKAAEDGPAYGVSVDKIAFDSITYGGETPAAQNITIKNTGVLATTISNVALSGTNAESFVLSDGETGELAERDDTNTSWTIKPNDNLDAGTYNATVTVTYTGRNGAPQTEEAEVSLTVDQVDATVTAPKAIPDLKYTGKDQALVETGSVTPGAGTMQYSLDDESHYGAEIPQGREAKTYTVYWKIDGADEENYNYGEAGTSGQVEVQITQGEADVKPTNNSIEYTYGNESGITLEVTVAPKTTGGIALTNAGTNQVEFDFPKGDNKIVPVDAESNKASVKIEANEVKDYFNAGSENTVTVNYGGSGNLNEGSTTIKVTVNPKTLDFTFTATPKTYDGTNRVDGNLADFQSQILEGDTVTATATATVEDFTVGDGKTVNVTVTLGGADKDYYEAKAITGVTVDISKATLTEGDVTAPTGKGSVDYTGSAVVLLSTEGKAPEGCTVKYAVKEGAPGEPGNEDWKDYAEVTGQDVGTYYVYWKVDGGTNYNEYEPESGNPITVSIEKTAPTLQTAPELVDGPLAYTSAEQGLIQTAAEYNGGTASYFVKKGDSNKPSASEGGWKETSSAITGTDAGTYYVWYKITGDANHADVEPTQIGSVEISKADSTVTVNTVASATYGSEITLTATVSSGAIEADKLDGTLTFKVGEASLGTGIKGGNKWTLTIGAADTEKQHTLFGTGSETQVTAVYEGNSNIAGKTSAATGVTVKPKELSFSFTANEKTYNGDKTVSGTLSPTGENGAVTEGLLSGDTVTATYKAEADSAEVSASPVNVTVTVTLAGKDAQYYKAINPAGVTVNIVKAENTSVTAPVGKTGLIYSGTDQELIQTAGSSDNGTMKYFVGSKAPEIGTDDWKDAADIKGKDAGTYTIWYYVVGDDNHNDTTPTSITVEIAQKEVELTWKLDDGDTFSVTYTGTPHNVTATANTSVSGESVNVTVEGGTQTDVGSSYTATATGLTDVDGADVAKNYKLPTDASKSYSITQAEPTVAVSASTEDEEITYGDKITLTATVTSGSIADDKFGNATVQFKIGGENFGDPVSVDTSTGTATLTIGADETEKQHTLFGTGSNTQVTAEYTGNDNISGGSGDTTVNVAQRALTYDVTATGKVYDGKTDVTVSLSPTNLVGIDSVTLTATGNLESADAKTYDKVNLSSISKSGADEEYYSVAESESGKSLSGSVTISPREVTLDWKLDGDTTFTIDYDGSPHTVTAEVNNKARAEDIVNVTVEVKPTSGGEGTGATATNAGTYTATATELTGGAASNYKLPDEKSTKAITINKINATVTAPTTNSLTYTGNPQGLISAATNVVGGMVKYALGENGTSAPGDVEFGESIPQETDAGTYYVWYYVDADGNHTNSEKAYVTVTIKKAEVTFTVSNNSHPYDGTEKKVTLGNSNTSGAPNLDETSGYTVTYGDDNTASKTDVAEYEIHIKLTDAAAKNYKFAGKGDSETELTVADQKLSITKATSTVSNVTITSEGEELTYGDEFTISAKVNALGTVTGTVTFKAGETELGEATSHDADGVWKITVGANEKEKQHAIFDNKTISVEYSGDDNINKSSGSKADFTVAKKPLTYTVTATGRVWNGETGVTVALEATNTVTGDEVTLTATGNLDNGGKAGTYSKVNLSEVQIGGADKDYYTTDSARDNVALTADIEISKAASSVTAPAGKSGLTYTGNPLELIDEATDVVGGTVKYCVGEEAPVDGSDEWQTEVAQITGTNAGTYKVWYYVDGDENHNDSAFASVDVTISPAEVSFTIGKENKVAWSTRDETNGDPNLDGYKLSGSDTNYALKMTYDSYTHTANVSQTESETVKIGAGAANGYKVTYRKDGAADDLTEVRNVGKYDIVVTFTPTADSIYNYAFKGQSESTHELKIGTIEITPYEVTVIWTHLSYVYHAHTMHPDIRVQNPFKSDNKQLLPGQGLPEGFETSSPESYTGEYLVAFGATEGSDVKEYTVTAGLYGQKAANYTVKNPTATVTIVPAPVTFTVSDNVWDLTGAHPSTVTLSSVWGVVSTTPDKDEGTDHQYPKPGTAIEESLNTKIVYKKDGEEITAPDVPTKAGTYEVWVEIVNTNFRHSATSDGASHKVGELVLTNDLASVKTYKVTFETGYEGGTAPAAMENLLEGQMVILPAGLTRDDYLFQGWSRGGITYRPNEEFPMPASDVTFKAEWLAMDETRSVGGTVVQEVEGSDPKPLLGATVTLKQGDNEAGEAITNADGKFSFEHLTPGIYNMEIRYFNGSSTVVKTFRVDVEKDSLDGETYIMPDGALNTVVEADVTAVVDMQDIVTEASDDGIYTKTDAETVEDGGTVEFKMSISEATLTGAQEEELPVSEEQISMVLDLELKKTVTSGGRSETENITDSKVPITTVIHLPAEIQGKSGYTVYRFHNVGGEEEMQTITTSRNANGEYLQVIRDGTAIELHAEFYSTYVLTWYQRSGGGGVVAYPVTLPESVEHGDVSVNYPNAVPGVNVTLTVTPDEGYELDELTVTDGNGNIIPVTDNGDGTYSFTMPSSGVVVNVEFKLTVCDGGDNCPSRAFPDLDVTAWYHEYTDYVIETKLMQGSGGLFKPNGTLTRAEMVTVLWNMNGRGVVNYLMTYGDVSEEDWYAEAIRWATSEGVVDGYDNGNFGPNDRITREQMAKMLYNYEKKYGDSGFTGAWMFPLPFADTAKINDWAYEAVAWCYMNGVINGKDGNVFDPAGNALRCELAKVLTVYNQIDD